MIKLLVVDDSALMRRLLSEIFGAEGDFEVEMARDGLEALDRAPVFLPDVITLDVQMPRLDGLETLDRLMLQRPCPVVMLSSLTAQGAETTLRALELGAVDFVQKPTGAVSLKIQDVAPGLVAKVRAAAGAKVRRTHRLAERIRLNAGVVRPSPRPSAKPSHAEPAAWSGAPLKDRDGLVLVGCSTGGPPALDVLLSGLPADLPWPVVVAQHMPASFTGPLAMRLDKLCALKVVEAAQPTVLQKGHVYIARGDADAVISPRPAGLSVVPIPSSETYRWHPSVDRLVDSAMAQLGAERLVGVLMTGMGNDGAASLSALKAAGGWTLAEAEETAVIWGMPGELVQAGGASEVAPLDRLGERLLARLGGLA